MKVMWISFKIIITITTFTFEPCRYVINNNSFIIRRTLRSYHINFWRFLFFFMFHFSFMASTYRILRHKNKFEFIILCSYIIYNFEHIFIKKYSTQQRSINTEYTFFFSPDTVRGIPA